MKDTSKSSKTATPISRPEASAGPDGVAIAPPAYGIDFLDHAPAQAQAGTGSHGGLALHRKAGPSTAGDNTNEVPPLVHEVLRSPSQPLDAQTRAFMEPRFGRDFSGVRVHTDEKAAQSAQSVNALAYTVGQDVVFGSGQYRPQSSAGVNLLAHELAHVVLASPSARSATLFSALPLMAENSTDEQAAHVLAEGRPLSKFHSEPPAVRRAATTDASRITSAAPPKANPTANRSSVTDGPPQKWVQVDDFNWVFYFERNKSDLLENHTGLDQIKTKLQYKTELAAEVYGHASTEGDTVDNKILAENRAQAVANYLFADPVKGIDRCTWAGKGSTEAGNEKGATSEEVEKRRALNRRVTVTLGPNPVWRAKWGALRLSVDGGLKHLQKMDADADRMLAYIDTETHKKDVSNLGEAAIAEVIQNSKDLKGQISYIQAEKDKLDAVKDQKGWEDYRKWCDTVHGGYMKLYNLSIANAKKALADAQVQLDEYTKAKNEAHMKLWGKVVEFLKDDLQAVTEAMQYALEHGNQ